MQIIPAIDLKNKKCVRLRQGKASDETVYSHNPVEIAKHWQDKGARRLHIVDLDGAFTGDMVNFDVIKAIRRALDIEIDVGGGIRTLERAEILIKEGIDRVIFGTVAVKNPEIVYAAAEKFADKITIGIDVKDNKVAIHGWESASEITGHELIKDMERKGINEFIYTDISTDGMLCGPHLEGVKSICSKTKSSIIASGGVAELEDIKDLLDLKLENLIGVITGKAIYDGRLDLEEAIKLAGNLC